MEKTKSEPQEPGRVAQTARSPSESEQEEQSEEDQQRQGEEEQCEVAEE